MFMFSRISDESFPLWNIKKSLLNSDQHLISCLFVSFCVKMEWKELEKKSCVYYLRASSGSGSLLSDFLKNKSVVFIYVTNKG